MHLNSKHKGGFVLPIVLVTIIITQIIVFSIIRIYENQMESYVLLIDHYQSQTLLTLSEAHLKKLPQTNYIQYNLGQVEVTKSDKTSLELTSTLNSGYQESKMVPKD